MKTKIEIVKEVFFGATNGKRSTNNYADGMWLIETVADKVTGEYIRYIYGKYISGEKSASVALDDMVDVAFVNLSGVNGITKRSAELMRAYHNCIN